MVIPNANDDPDPFLRGQEPSICWGVREEEPEKYRGNEGQDAGNGNQPLPGFKTWGVDVGAAEGKQAQEDDGNAVHEDWERGSGEIISESNKHTPVSSPLDLFNTCIEHGGDLKQSVRVTGTRLHNKIAHTIMNPGVTAPSHIPRMKRTASKPPKSLQAA